ncbi:hypothetical protein pb186bvf_021204 [Paramecium bursaria]
MSLSVKRSEEIIQRILESDPKKRISEEEALQQILSKERQRVTIILRVQQQKLRDFSQATDIKDRLSGFGRQIKGFCYKRRTSRVESQIWYIVEEQKPLLAKHGNHLAKHDSEVEYLNEEIEKLKALIKDQQNRLDNLPKPEVIVQEIKTEKVETQGAAQPVDDLVIKAINDRLKNIGSYFFLSQRITTIGSYNQQFEVQIQNFSKILQILDWLLSCYILLLLMNLSQIRHTPYQGKISLSINFCDLLNKALEKQKLTFHWFMAQCRILFSFTKNLKIFQSQNLQIKYSNCPFLLLLQQQTIQYFTIIMLKIHWIFNSLRVLIILGPLFTLVFLYFKHNNYIYANKKAYQNNKLKQSITTSNFCCVYIFEIRNKIQRMFYSSFIPVDIHYSQIHLKIEGAKNSLFSEIFSIIFSNPSIGLVLQCISLLQFYSTKHLKVSLIIEVCNLNWLLMELSFKQLINEVYSIIFQINHYENAFIHQYMKQMFIFITNYLLIFRHF